MPSRPFDFGDLRGTAAADLFPAAAESFEAEVRRLLDPANARETVHWGRNYLYAASTGGVEVVVKQFRHDRLLARMRRARKGSNALRSWRSAAALTAAGVETPEPLLYAESRRLAGPAFYVCRRLGPAMRELRFFLRALNAGRAAADFPEVEPRRLLAALAGQARSLHEAGVWHRDWTSGNVFYHWRGEQPPRLFLLDLNRARLDRPLTLWERMRELARMPVLRDADQALLLEAYFGGSPPPLARHLYRLFHRSFLLKNETKRSLRAGAAVRGGGAWRRRTAHTHIPPASAGAARRDRIVWDALTDQPHQHASRAGKLAVRLRDAPAHGAALAGALAAMPRVLRRYRELRAKGPREGPWPGLGVGLRPWPRAPGALLAAFDELGARRACLRLHPWQERHEDEEALAAALAERGVDLAFALPQNRDLVKDLGRWRGAVEELGARFARYGRLFQVGQAINRSKWGVWTLREYARLAETACEVLRRIPGVEIAGPAVIDFEFLHAAAVLDWRGPEAFDFDVVSSLLYVDRRGAPENKQLGFDTAAKVTLLRALADTGRRVRRPGPEASRCWVSEMNWPLREGPHSPAGRAVSVDEERQADYLVRYARLAYGTGLLERIDWWQLIASGYGLIDPRDGTLRRRPAFHAFARLERERSARPSQSLVEGGGAPTAW